MWRLNRGAWLIVGVLFPGYPLARMGVARFLGAFDELGKFAKVLQAVALAASILTAGGGENVDLRAVEIGLLQTVVAFTLGKLFVDDLAVKSHHVRREFTEFLRKNNAAFGEILAREFLDALGGFLDEIGEANPEFDDAAVVGVVEWFGDHARFIEH